MNNVHLNSLQYFVLIADQKKKNKFDFTQKGVSRFVRTLKLIECKNLSSMKKMAKEVLVLVLHKLHVSDLPTAKTKKTVFGICTGEQECVRISVRMKVKNGILLGKNVVELIENK